MDGDEIAEAHERFWNAGYDGARTSEREDTTLSYITSNRSTARFYPILSGRG